MTKILHLVEHLKQVEIPLNSAQLGTFIGQPLDDNMIHVLRSHDKLVYNTADDTYAFKPLHNIRSAQQLLTHLQAATTSQGLSVKELKEGWANAIQTIDELERNRDILVTRTKKDGQARMVWINDKTLDVNVDEGRPFITQNAMTGVLTQYLFTEFKTIWTKVVIPPPAELPGELEKAGLKPTSVDPATIKKAMAKDNSKKQKKPRRGRITNTHLVGMLRDY